VIRNLHATLATACAKLLGISDQQPLDLTNLAVSAGTLDPRFDPSITEYTLDLRFDDDVVAVTATSNDVAATLTIADQAIVSGTPQMFAVEIGDAPIDITASSPTGVIAHYLIHARRPDLAVAFRAPASVVGVTELVAGCTSERALGIMARKYRLCDVVVSGAEFAERINHLTMADALAVKRTLEHQLRFCMRKDPGGVEPEPLEVDVAELCRKPGRSGLSAGLCRYFWRDVHTLEWRTFPDEDNRLLAEGLNELYGITSTTPCPP